MRQQQMLILIVVGLYLAFIIYRKLKLGGNKVKLKEMLQHGAKIIDVRSRGEFSTGHFSGAVNIPLDELQGSLTAIGDKNNPVIVYCASGMRSGSAQRVLQAAGFTQVENGVNQGHLQSL